MSAYASLGSQSSDFFFVTLFSNSSLFHPSNTPSNFTNKLFKSIELPKRAGWQVALFSLHCNNQFNNATKVYSDGRRRMLSQIHVRCPQVSIPYDWRNLISCHSRRPFDAGARRVHSYEPTHLQFFTLQGETLTELGIELLDSDLRPLKYRRSQPTVCTLIFRKTMTLQYMPLWIHSRNPEKSENTASNFRTSLPPLFNNNTEFHWQIALTSITFTPTFLTVPNSMMRHKPGLVIALVDLDDPDSPAHLDMQEHNLTLPSTNYISAGTRGNLWPSPPPSQDGEPHYRLQDDSWKWLEDESMLVGGIELLLKMPKFRPANSLERPIVELRNQNKSGTRKQLIFHSEAIFYLPIFLAEMLGFREYATTRDSALAVFAGRQGDTFLSRQQVDTNALAPQTMSVVCDFIQPAFVGGVQSPVLKTVPVKFLESGARDSSLTYEPKNLEYHTINSRQLGDLHFQLFDSAGSEIQFKDYAQNVILGLTIKTR